MVNDDEVHQKGQKKKKNDWILEKAFPGKSIEQNQISSTI